jgi:long-chain acyl-CoA synthetase
VAKLDTFPKLLRHQATTLEQHPAMREKEYGIWQTWSWSDYFQEVKQFAAGLSALGFQPGDKLFIIGQNRPRMYFAMSAAQCLGGIPVPTYYDSVAEEMKFVISHAEAKYVVGEGQEQVDKILEIKDDCKNIQCVIYDDSRGLNEYPEDFVKSFDSIQKTGAELLKATPDLIEKLIDNGKGEDISVMLYTSGTTGQPKGVVLTFDNVRSIAEVCVDYEGLNKDDLVIAYLPMAWIVDYFISYAQAHVAGFCVCCPESPETVEADGREIGPTYHFTSPRILENHRTSIMIRMEDASTIKRTMFHYFLGVAKRCNDITHAGKSLSVFDKFLYGMGRFLVYEPLKNQLGYSRARLTYTAGEAIGPDMFDFYRSIGLHLKQVYGQTEASPFVTVQPDHQVRSDTVGTPIKNVEIKLAEDGEVLFKSPGVFHSYYKNPEATASTKTADGWVKTGDTGFFDQEGHLKIIDRTKDVGKLNDGSMFAPKYIENKLKFFPYILEAITFGDQKDEVTAFINIDLSAVGDWAERKGLSYASYQELAGHQDTYQLISECIEKVNADLANDEMLSGSQIQRFLILHKELDADDGELTRTRKVRRRIITERYGVLIESLYNGAEHCEISIEVTFEDGRKGALSGDLKIQPVKSFNKLAKSA